MKFLNKKLRRDILRNWTQFFSVFLMAFLSVLVYVGLEGAWHGMDTSINEYMYEYNLADAWINGTGFSDEKIAEISDIEGVTDISVKTRISVSIPSDTEGNNYLFLETMGTSEITQPHISRGADVSDTISDGIWIDLEYAKQHKLSVGDEIECTYNGNSKTLMIQGIIQLPSRMYYTGTSEFVAPNPDLYGYGMISEDTLTNEFGYQGLPNLLELTGDANSIREKAPIILGETYISYSGRNTLFDVSNAIDRVVQIKDLSVLFSFIFIILAILAMYTTIKRLIETQTQDVATLKALGYSNTLVSWHYSSFGLFIGGLGALGGTLVSPIMSLIVLETQKPMFSLPVWKIGYTWTSLMVILIVISICTISAFLASRNARKGLPAKFLRGASVKKAQTVFIEKFSSIWSKFDFGSRWAWRDGRSNWVRIAMGIIGVSGSMMLLMAGLGMPDSMNGQVDDSYGHDFTYTSRIKVEVHTTDEEKQLLENELGGQWIQTLSTRITPDDGIDRVLTIMSDGDYINVQTADGEHVADGGIYITEGVADSANISVGDIVKLSVSMDTKEYEFEVKGILISSVPQGGYVTESAWKEAGGKFTPLNMLLGDDISMDMLESNDYIEEIITIDEQIKIAKGLVLSLWTIFLMIIGFAVLLAVVILYNLGALSFTEKRRDYATLRVLGYHKKEIRLLTMKENIVTTLVGWLLGIPIGYWFLEEYVSTFSTFQIVYYAKLSTISLIIASAIAILCSLTTTFLLSKRIEKLDMIEAIKGVE